MGEGWTHSLNGEVKEEEGVAFLVGATFFPFGYSIGSDIVARSPAGLLATWPRHLLHRGFALVYWVDPKPVHLIIHCGP